jgi:hypothetical protein
MTTFPTPVQAAIDAANAGDSEAFLAAFGDEGAVDDCGRVFRGPDAIRQWSDGEFIGKQVSLRVTGSRVSEDVVVVSTEVGGNGFNGPSDFAFSVSGDQITLMRITG